MDARNQSDDIFEFHLKNCLAKFEFMSMCIHSDQPWLLVCVLKGREEEEDEEWGVILKKKELDSSKEERRYRNGEG